MNFGPEKTLPSTPSIFLQVPRGTMNNAQIIYNNIEEQLIIPNNNSPLTNHFNQSINNNTNAKTSFFNLEK